MEEKKPNKSEFPTDPFIRSYLRWTWLFKGTIEALHKKNPQLTYGLLESYKQFGLIAEICALGIPYWRDLFRPNPTDDILQKARNFSESASIPNMKGKKIRWFMPLDKLLETPDDVWSYISYFQILPELKKLSKFKNSNVRLKFLKERFATMVEKVHLKKGILYPTLF